MSTIPYIRDSADGLDLSNRLAVSTSVVGSPALAEEAIVASITLSQSIAVEKGILLVGYAAFTVGTSGVTANLRIRQTDTSGTVIVASGATTVAATNLKAVEAVGFDTAATLPGQVYKLTLQIGSGAAASTVSAVCLAAFII